MLSEEVSTRLSKLIEFLQKFEREIFDACSKADEKASLFNKKTNMQEKPVHSNELWHNLRGHIKALESLERGDITDTKPVLDIIKYMLAGKKAENKNAAAGEMVTEIYNESIGLAGELGLTAPTTANPGLTYTFSKIFKAHDKSPATTRQVQWAADVSGFTASVRQTLKEVVGPQRTH